MLIMTLRCDIHVFDVSCTNRQYMYLMHIHCDIPLADCFQLKPNSEPLT